MARKIVTAYRDRKNSHKKAMEVLKEKGVTLDELAEFMCNNTIVDKDGWVVGHKTKEVEIKGTKGTLKGKVVPAATMVGNFGELEESRNNNSSSSFWAGFWGVALGLLLFGGGGCE